jgi:hypothetical protein
MIPTDPGASPAPDAIRPLKDVWLRPRRVFRELAARPVTVTNYALAAVLGIGNLLAFFRAQPFEGHSGAGEILLNSLIFGPICGVASMYLFAAIYVRLGARAGGNSSRDALFHVLTYGAMPLIAALGVRAVGILLIGDSVFVAAPKQELEGFQAIVLLLQLLASVFLCLWSVTLQVMGFSELQGVAMRTAFGIWVLGQLLAAVALVTLLVIAAILFPGLLPAPTT